MNWWDKLLSPVVENWPLIVVAVWGILVARRTLNSLIEQTAATKTAADAAMKSAEVSERALRLAERADVLLESAGIVLSPSGVFDGDARLVLRFKNFGHTRATDVRFDVRMIIPDLADLPGPQLPLTVIAANQGQSVSFQPFRESLTKNTFEDIVQGRITLRFVSWLIYQDAFGGSYTTRDVGIFDPRTLTFRIEEQNAG